MDRNQEILKDFPASQSWENHYKTLIRLGKELPLYPEEDKKDKFLVKGCMARVWLKAEMSQEGEVIFSGGGEEEALISRGLLALMLRFYSHRTPEDILKSEPLFLKQIQMDEHLSPSRTNGLYSLLKQMKSYAQAFLIISDR